MANIELFREFMDMIREHWPELAAQDRYMNGGGTEIDLLAAFMYAQKDGISFERYIVDTLRAERIRRQEQDALVQNQVMLDDLIDRARAAGMGVLEFAATEYGDHDGDVRKLSRDFVEKIVRRLEEREAE